VQPVVTLELDVQPPVDSAITVDGKPVVGRPPRAVVPTGTAEVVITVAAPGFTPVTLGAVPDRDRLVSVHLARLSPGPPGEVAPAKGEGSALPAPAAAGSSRVPGAAGQPAFASPSRGAPPRAPAPKSRARGKDALVTEYPF